jgi:hypothetical protein
VRAKAATVAVWAQCGRDDVRWLGAETCGGECLMAQGGAALGEWKRSAWHRPRARPASRTGIPALCSVHRTRAGLGVRYDAVQRRADRPCATSRAHAVPAHSSAPQFEQALLD